MFVDVKSRHGKTRIVRIPAGTKKAIDAYVKAAGLRSGSLFRPVNRWGSIKGESSLSDQAVYNAVVEYAQAVALDISPDKLRKTLT